IARPTWTRVTQAKCGEQRRSLPEEAEHGEDAMVSSGWWTFTLVFRLLLVGRQDVSAVALSPAAGVLSAAVLPGSVPALLAVCTASVGLCAFLGTVRLRTSLRDQLMTLRPWCFSYHRRSSGRQDASARRPMTSVTAAASAGPRLHSRPGVRTAAA